MKIMANKTKQSSLTGVARELVKGRIRTLEIECADKRRFCKIQLDEGTAHFDKGWDAKQWRVFWEQQIVGKKKQYRKMLQKLSSQVREMTKEFPDYNRSRGTRPPPASPHWFIKWALISRKEINHG